MDSSILEDKVIFKPKLNNLSRVIINILESHGPLSSSQLHNLINCYIPFGLVGQEALTNNAVSAQLNELMLNNHLISYSADRGTWRLNDNPIERVQYHYSIEETLDESLKGLSSRPSIPQVIGIGDEFVYVIYETLSRVSAILTSRSRWLLKVGRTRDLDRRILDLNVGGSQSMVVGVAFKTANSKSLEKFIHSELRKESRQAEIQGRREWFFSNIEEIKSLRDLFESKNRIVA